MPLTRKAVMSWVEEAVMNCICGREIECMQNFGEETSWKTEEDIWE